MPKFHLEAVQNQLYYCCWYQKQAFLVDFVVVVYHPLNDVIHKEKTTKWQIEVWTRHRTCRTYFLCSTLWTVCHLSEKSWWTELIVPVEYVSNCKSWLNPLATILWSPNKVWSIPQVACVKELIECCCWVSDWLLQSTSACNSCRLSAVILLTKAKLIAEIKVDWMSLESTLLGYNFFKDLSSFCYSIIKDKYRYPSNHFV